MSFRNGIFIAIGVIIVLLYFIKDTDYFIRTFDPVSWELKQQKKKQARKKLEVYLSKSEKLAIKECEILVAAKESTIPIVAEHNVLNAKYFYGDNHKTLEEATYNLKQELEEYRLLCSELAESPYISRNITIIKIMHARKLLNKKSITPSQFETMRVNAIKEGEVIRNGHGDTCYDNRGQYSC